jgi:dipeptidyl aminopeptidase/acylaminoacyl peptidase
VFIVGVPDLRANRTATRLMKISASGGAPVEVTGTPGGVNALRWSPDGRRLAFFGTKDGRAAVWTLDVATGAVTRVCDYDRSNSFLSKAGNALAWSPDGSRLAFAGTLEPAPAADPVVVSRIQYKTRTALSDNRRAHIFVAPAMGGAPRVVTRGEFDEHSIAWGGDGSEIVFLSNREPDPDANLNYDIFAVNVASGAVRRITRTPGVEFDPRVSPDGRWIAYAATTRAVTTIDSVAEDTHVWIVPASGGAARELNHALDRRSGSPEWAPDNRAVLYTAQDHGKTALYRAPVDGGAPVALVDRRAQVGPYTVANTGLIVFGQSDPSTPREVFALAPGGEPRQLTTLAPAAKTWQLVTPETITFRSFDGIGVEGWYYPPLNPPARHPLILTIHGGPHGMYGYGFNASVQLNAARGYATVAINPRGSSGYGQAFADGCVNNWGGGDYKDLMAGVDHVLATHASVDPDRLGVMGGSYGGFMTNWVITQTDRFKAAVSSASVSNLISFYATSLYQDLVHAEFNGYPWDGSNFELLWKWSPLAHVGHVVTPTLFIHGEQDNDVHITQAEEMYTALRQRKIEAALARYPREGHGFREPKHRLDGLERTLAWMDRFLMRGAAKPTAGR